MSLWIAIIILLLIAANFVLYPFLLLICSVLLKKKSAADLQNKPISVSFIVVAHNAEQLIATKINNLLSLDLKNITYDIVVYLDGCCDKTFEILESFSDPRLQVINNLEHLGKIAGLNTASVYAKNEILIYTDTDALLTSEGIYSLIDHFSDPYCGGVCGLRRIAKNDNRLSHAQKLYINVDSYIKYLESKLCNITSNDGKLYAIRRTLFKPIADAVTDDLFACLNITEQGYRFIFEPRAIAYINTPSHSHKHELNRRRRIITRSLNGIFLKKQLLNPFKFGLFAIGLFINKILRRMLMLELIILFIASYLNRSYHPAFELFFDIQVVFYLLAVCSPLLVFVSDSRFKPLLRIASVSGYFLVGNWATLMGVADFLMGKRISKWIPQKYG